MLNNLKPELILQKSRPYVRYLKFAIPLMVFLAIALIWVWNVPHLIQARVLHQIEIATGIVPQPETVEYNGNLIMMKNIRLDHEGIDTLDSLGIIFSPLSYFGSIKLNSILIDSPSQTRSFVMPTADFPVHINKLIMQESLLALADTIEIRDATWDIITEDVGAIRVRAEGLIRTEEETGLKSFQFSLDSRQKNFAIDARLSGSIQRGNSWNAEMVLDSLSFNIPNLNILRSSGVLNMGGTSDNSYYLTGESNIGSLEFYGYPLKELAAGFELSQDGISWTIGGMALAQETIEMGASYNSAENELVQGSVYATDLAALTHYLWPDSTETKQLERLAVFKDSFFTYAIRPADIFKPAKSLRVSMENFDLAPLPQAFPRQIKQAEGQANIQFVVTVDQLGFRTTKGIIYAQEPGSVLFNRGGRRDFLGAEVARQLKADMDYQNFQINMTGDILSDEANWTAQINPQNSAEALNLNLTRSAAPLKEMVLQ